MNVPTGILGGIFGGALGWSAGYLFARKSASQIGLAGAAAGALWGATRPAGAGLLTAGATKVQLAPGALAPVTAPAGQLVLVAPTGGRITGVASSNQAQWQSNTPTFTISTSALKGQQLQFLVVWADASGVPQESSFAASFT